MSAEKRDRLYDLFRKSQQASQNLIRDSLATLSSASKDWAPQAIFSDSPLEFYQKQLLVHDKAVYDFVLAQSEFIPSDNEKAYEFFVSLIRNVEKTYGDLTVSASHNYLRANRRLHNQPSDLPVATPDYLGDRRVKNIARQYANRLLVDRGAAIVEVANFCAKTVFNRGRNTIKLSAKAAQTFWYRVPETGACAFCLMLASRGAVYADEYQAGGSHNRFHKNCRCTVAEFYRGGAYDKRTQMVLDGSWKFGLRDKKDWEYAKESEEYLEWLWQTHIRDDPTRESRLGPSLLPEGFQPVRMEVLPSDKRPPLTLKDLEVNCLGRRERRRSGNIKHYGGHLSGVNFPKKSEFPPNWTVEDIIHAAFTTMYFPQWSSLRSTQRTLRREVHGVLVEAAYYVEQGAAEPKYSHAVPRNGRQVVWNDSKTGQKVLRPFSPDLLYEK